MWASSLGRTEKISLRKLLTPKWTEYIAVSPTPKQHAGCILDEFDEMLFGGAGGGGKSIWLLMGALQYVDHREYSALLLRKTLPELEMRGGLMDVAGEWLHPTAAEWSGRKKQWRFPSGATLQFGYLETEVDKFRYKSAAFHYVGFDELTTFTRSQYLYLFTRMRRGKDSPIPMRMRAASNPGGPGHEWVKERFVDPGSPGRIFLRAGLDDNPYIDKAEYINLLMHLDPVERARIMEGDWSAREAGTMLRRDWFRVVDAAPKQMFRGRRWDLAATKPKPRTDPDYTAGVKMGQLDGQYWIEHITRTRDTSARIELLIAHTAKVDGHQCMQRMEQEPGASGKAVIDHYARRVLIGYDFKGVRSTGDKTTRARPLASAAEQGYVNIVRAPWNEAFLDEAEIFPPPPGRHDDMVDAASGAFEDVSAEPFFLV